MKRGNKFLIASLILLLGVITSTVAKVTVKGTIKGYKNDGVMIYLDLTGQGVPLKIAKDGSFMVTLEVSKPKYDVAITIGEEGFYQVYFEPEGHYIFNADINGGESDYSLTGSNLKENAFLKDYILKFHRTYRMFDRLKAYSSYSEYSFQLHKIADSLESALKETKKVNFINHFSMRLYERKKYFEFSYEFIKLAKHVQEYNNANDYVFDPSYSKFIKSESWVSMNDSTFLSFKDVFNSYLMTEYKDADPVDILKVLKHIVPLQNVLNEYATLVVSNFLSSGSKGNVDKIIAYYNDICTDKTSQKKIEELKKQSAAFMPGAGVIDFEMKDKDGKVFKLSDFKGKALYIDVWATWCGPCKKEIPFFEKLVKLFEGDNRIEFVSISVDADEKSWKKMLSEQAHNWKQFIVENDFKSDLCTKYQIQAIPRFMLFDKDGKIVNVNASRPSDETTVNDIKSIL